MRCVEEGTRWYAEGRNGVAEEEGVAMVGLALHVGG